MAFTNSLSRSLAQCDQREPLEDHAQVGGRGDRLLPGEYFSLAWVSSCSSLSGDEPPHPLSL